MKRYLFFALRSLCSVRVLRVGGRADIFEWVEMPAWLSADQRRELHDDYLSRERDQDLGCSILHLASDRFAAATLESCWCSLHTCLMVCVQFAYSDILRDLLVDILGRSRTLQRPVQSGRGNRDESLEHAAKVRASARTHKRNGLSAQAHYLKGPVLIARAVGLRRIAHTHVLLHKRKLSLLPYHTNTSEAARCSHSSSTSHGKAWVPCQKRARWAKR